MKARIDDTVLRLLRQRLYELSAAHQDIVDTLTWLQEHPEATVSHVQVGAAFVTTPAPVQALVERKKAYRKRMATLNERIRAWSVELEAEKAKQESEVTA